MSNYDRIAQLCPIKKFDQCPHMQLEADQFFAENLVTTSMAQPVEGIDLMALVKQMRDDLVLTLRTPLAPFYHQIDTKMGGHELTFLHINDQLGFPCRRTIGGRDVSPARVTLGLTLINLASAPQTRRVCTPSPQGNSVISWRPSLRNTISLNTYDPRSCFCAHSRSTLRYPSALLARCCRPSSENR